jgi:hypothetical protein
LARNATEALPGGRNRKSSGRSQAQKTTAGRFLDPTVGEWSRELAAGEELAECRACVGSSVMHASAASSNAGGRTSAILRDRVTVNPREHIECRDFAIDSRAFAAAEEEDVRIEIHPLFAGSHTNAAQTRSSI